MSRDESDELSAVDEDDSLIDEDEFLLQRYLDADLSDGELLKFEARLERDADLRSRLEHSQALFAALDSSALARSALMWSEDVPNDLVERAIDRWREARPAEEEASPEHPVFAGFFQPGRILVFANVLLLLALGVVAFQQGPEVLLRTWLVACKDLALFLAAAAPTPQQLAYGLPLLLVSCITGLLVLGRIARGFLGGGR